LVYSRHFMTLHSSWFVSFVWSNQWM